MPVRWYSFPPDDFRYQGKPSVSLHEEPHLLTENFPMGSNNSRISTEYQAIGNPRSSMTQIKVPFFPEGSMFIVYKEGFLFPKSHGGRSHPTSTITYPEGPHLPLTPSLQRDYPPGTQVIGKTQLIRIGEQNPNRTHTEAERLSKTVPEGNIRE